jgi:hypothetical protein
MRAAPILALLTLASAAPAAAALPVSPLIDIYESYNDCFKVATRDGLKLEALGALGWSRATVSKDGKPIDNAPIIYGHAKRAPVILLSAEKTDGLCIVMARIESANAFEEFKKAWGGKLPAPDKEGAIYFSAEGQPIRLQQTGTPQQPVLTIAVMAKPESK